MSLVEKRKRIETCQTSREFFSLFSSFSSITEAYDERDKEESSGVHNDLPWFSLSSLQRNFFSKIERLKVRNKKYVVFKCFLCLRSEE